MTSEGKDVTRCLLFSEAKMHTRQMVKWKIKWMIQEAEARYGDFEIWKSIEV